MAGMRTAIAEGRFDDFRRQTKEDWGRGGEVSPDDAVTKIGCLKDLGLFVVALKNKRAERPLVFPLGLALSHLASESRIRSSPNGA